MSHLYRSMAVGFAVLVLAGACTSGDTTSDEPRNGPRTFGCPCR
ncbi:MAG: hypothetical protein AAF367_03290 [Pseudomonadota bacterium]